MGAQSSIKSGMKSTAKKLGEGSSRRQGFGEARPSAKKSGAFGKEDAEHVTGMMGRSLNVKRDKAAKPKTRTAGEG
jgi:hypothetical protein